MRQVRTGWIAAGSGLVFALATGFLVWQTIAVPHKGAGTPVETVEVLAAATAIPDGDRLSQTNVVAADVPVSIVPDQVILFRDASDHYGARVGSRVAKGELLTSSRLADGSSLDKVAPAHSAVTVSVDAVHALGGEVIPGMKVDLYAEESLGTVVELCRDVRVISTSVQAVEQDAGGSLLSSGSPGAASIAWATIEVPDNQVQGVVQASSAGFVYMVLRANGTESSRG